MSKPAAFTPLTIAVLVVSDTRDQVSDKSGAYLERALREAGHRLHERCFVRDEPEQITERIKMWCSTDAPTRVVLITGGTGLTARDSTPEAVRPLFDREIEGFGELFRSLSWEEIGPSTIQSRALAGMYNGCFIFVLPGSTGACRLAWKKIISPQLDSRTRPCNLADLLPRIPRH